MMPSVKNYIILALAAALVVASLATWQYRRMFKATNFALQTQNEAIRNQKAEAESLLERLTVERNELQDKLNKTAKAVETQDAKNATAIAADDTAQRAAPVRVRCVAPAGRQGGGSPQGDRAPAAAGGAGQPAETSGVLPEASARRLADALTEIETNNRAYAACYARLLKKE